MYWMSCYFVINFIIFLFWNCRVVRNVTHNIVQVGIFLKVLTHTRLSILEQRSHFKIHIFCSSLKNRPLNKMYSDLHTS